MDIPRNFHIMLCVMFSISVYNDGHKRRQTSRHVIEVEIQTNCNCKAHPCYFNYLLDCIWCQCLMRKLKLPHIILIQLYILVSCLMITFASYSKIFRALRLHYTQIQDYAQQHPSQPNVLNIARYRKAVYNTLWVQLALFVCYLPYCILVILITFSKISPTHLAFSVALTEVFISFNSNLNPFIYCWKISEVRQAVKQTLRQTLCCS